MSYLGVWCISKAILGLSPGPKTFSMSPITFDFTFPKKLLWPSSKHFGLEESTKVEVGLQHVFFALIRSLESEQKRS